MYVIPEAVWPTRLLPNGMLPALGMFVWGTFVPEAGRYTPGSHVFLFFACRNPGRDGEKQEYKENRQHHANDHANGRLDK